MIKIKKYIYICIRTIVQDRFSDFPTYCFPERRSYFISHPGGRTFASRSSIFPVLGCSFRKKLSFFVCMCRGTPLQCGGVGGDDGCARKIDNVWLWGRNAAVDGHVSVFCFFEDSIRSICSMIWCCSKLNECWVIKNGVYFSTGCFLVRSRYRESNCLFFRVWYFHVIFNSGQFERALS